MSAAVSLIAVAACPGACAACPTLSIGLRAAWANWAINSPPVGSFAAPPALNPRTAGDVGESPATPPIPAYSWKGLGLAGRLGVCSLPSPADPSRRCCPTWRENFSGFFGAVVVLGGADGAEDPCGGAELEVEGVEGVEGVEELGPKGVWFCWGLWFCPWLSWGRGVLLGENFASKEEPDLWFPAACLTFSSLNE